MFCTNCGHKNQPGAKFCESCGSMQVDKTADSIHSAGGKKHSTNWKTFSLVTSILVIGSFLLPWINFKVFNWTFLSFTGKAISSGPYFPIELVESSIPERIMEMAEDIDIGDVLEEFYADDLSGDFLRFRSYPLFFAVPLMGLIGLLGLSDIRDLKYAAIASGIIGVLVLCVFYFKISGVNSQMILFS